MMKHPPPVKPFHPLNGYTVCKNNFFKNPKKVLDLFDRLDYFPSSEYPGIRTINIFESNDELLKDFGLYLAKKISMEIFPGIYDFLIDIRFHKNIVNDDDRVNHGWIHNDEAHLAGLIYLNPFEKSLNTGTSIYHKINPMGFSVPDYPSRHEFNKTNEVTEEYLNDLDNNRKQFIETIRIGNFYNRCVGYDAKMFHRPTFYKTECGEQRTSLLFFIKDYNYSPISKVDIETKWIE